jgi:flagellar protein FlbT
MPGLVLKMPPGDRIVVNGAVIENAGRGARLRLLSPDTNLLRLRDAIDPSTAVTPVGRITHAVQLAVAGEVGMDELRAQVLPAIEALSKAFPDAEGLALLADADRNLRAGDAYRALRCLQRALRREQAVLSACSEGPGAGSRCASHGRMTLGGTRDRA